MPMGTTDTSTTRTSIALDVVADELDLAEPVADHGDAGAPERATDEVEGDKGAVVHPADACDDRRERPHDRHEAAITIAFGPCCSKNACAFSMFSILNSRESGRRKSDGPTFRPNRYPVCSPATAATAMSAATSASGWCSVPDDDQQTRREQQRVAGQEESDQQSGLGEHDQQHAPQAVRVDQMVRVEPARAEREIRHDPKVSIQC